MPFVHVAWIGSKGLQLDDVAEGGKGSVTTGNGEVSDRGEDVALVDRDGLVFLSWHSKTVRVDTDVALTLELVLTDDSFHMS